MFNHFVVDGSVARVKVSHPYNGAEDTWFIVDASDLPKLEGYAWMYKDGKSIAGQQLKTHKHKSLKKTVLDIPQRIPVKIRHKNGNELDFRKCNLEPYGSNWQSEAEVFAENQFSHCLDTPAAPAPYSQADSDSADRAEMVMKVFGKNVKDILSYSMHQRGDNRVKTAEITRVLKDVSSLLLRMSREEANNG